LCTEHLPLTNVEDFRAVHVDFQLAF
jgi:hypothetical protein